MEREGFELKRIKIAGSGLDVEYSFMSGDVSITRKESRTDLVHPDLMQEICKFRRVVARVLGLFSFLPLAGEAQREDFDEMLEGLISDTEVTGIGFVGEGEGEAVIISAVVHTTPTMRTKVRTAKLPLSSLDGFDTGRLKDEVFAYCFEGKSAQLSLFE